MPTAAARLSLDSIFSSLTSAGTTSPAWRLFVLKETIFWCPRREGFPVNGRALLKSRLQADRSLDEPRLIASAGVA